MSTGVYLLIHFMICHSKKCHRPRTSSCHKNSKVEQNTECNKVAQQNMKENHSIGSSNSSRVLRSILL